MISARPPSLARRLRLDLLRDRSYAPPAFTSRSRSRYFRDDGKECLVARLTRHALRDGAGADQPLAVEPADQRGI